ncbi:MAG TPA: SDR family oxidoreductase [Gemmatimonadales bacterium]|nr:SDR family oxidoreductase [Gemmatimonadales bacterium]
MRYLVTGGAGFIGSHVVEHLVAAGQEVVVLDDLSSGRLENLAGVRDAIRFIEGSVTALGTCRRAVEGVDCVLHQAALTSVERSVREPRVAHEVNATGTINLLLAARDAGVRRVVYAGSTSAYGNAAELPNSENQLTRPLSPYASSKLAAEESCRAFHATYGIETVVLRYFNVFGPRQDPKSQYAAVVPRFITAALRDERPAIYGDGRQTRDFVYVANVVRANLLASRAPAARVTGEIFNVGSGRSVSVIELWTKIRELVGVDLDPEYRSARAGEVRDSLASVDKARDLIGYEPTVTFEAGLALTVAHYRHGNGDGTQGDSMKRRAALQSAGGS